MRFIRDIIVERSGEGAKAAQTLQARTPVEHAAPKAPEPPAAMNRTFTRVSTGFTESFDEDDVFQRLVATEPKPAAEARPAGDDPADDDADVLDRLLSDSDEDDGEINLFAEDDDSDEIADDARADVLPAADDIPAAPAATAAPAAPDVSEMDAAMPAPMPAADEAGSQAVRVPPAFPSFGAVSGRSQAAQALIDQGPAPQKPAAAQAGVQRDMPMPQPATGRSGRVEGRVKTRLLGFGTGDLAPRDPFAAAEPQRQDGVFPVGWLVVIQGPGRGASFPLYSGVSQIGRGEDQTVRLDFGDTSISRSNHAAIAYDPEQRGFFLGHGGKANMVRLNNRPVLSTEDLHHGAQIRIGETTLRFVAFCDDGFAWGKDEGL